MDLALIILFLAVGIIFLLVEILITPGIILGAIGIGFMTFGVMKTYSTYGQSVGNTVLVSVFVGTIAIVILALKGGVWKRMASKDAINSKAGQDSASLAKIGDIGKTVSALRPSGNAYFEGVKVEVTTLGEPIPPNTEVEVIKIADNKIIVKQI